ncbi:MAG: HAD-IIB family hydrolase [Phycisphaerales bacterium]|nr:HAD-IIB family hydrolase [Phycisphaerales bacterium]
MDRSIGYDLIAIDVDGTLLDTSHRVPPAHRDALHRAHDAGLRVVICTGRSYPEIRAILDHLSIEFDATITVSGALVSHAATGRTLSVNAIEPSAAARLHTWLRELGYAVLWLANRAECGHDGYALAGPRMHAGHRNWLDKTPCVVHPVETLPPNPAAALRLSVIDDRPALQVVAGDLVRRFAGEFSHNLLDAPSYRLTVLEILAAHVSKWRAIESLCGVWGIDTRRTAAVGDDVNDLEMVRRAGLGVAMGNAVPAVRAVARRTTLTNDEGGLAVVIDDILAGRA